VNSERLAGIDIARGFALGGMSIAHAAPRADESELIVDGRSALLFATLAGVSLGLMSGGARPTQRRGQMRVAVLLRALFLVGLGLLLWVIPTNIAIILDYYGVMFLLLVPLLFVRRGWLAGIAVVLFVVAPLLATQVNPIATDASTPWQVALILDRLLTGHYPALVWLPVLIVGLIAARSDLRRPRVQYTVAIGGILAAAVGYGTAALLPGLSAEAHSSTHAEILGSGGFAFAVIGVLLIATRPGSGWSRMLGRLLSPIEAMGAMPLTVYTAQILVIASFFVAEGRQFGVEYQSWWLVAGLVVGSALFAVLWRRFAGRGPLEYAIRRLSSPPSEHADV
jgi:uncharacterized membrane protein YeiB